MKIICNSSANARSLRGMTLAELMVSLAIFMMLMAAFITVNMFGMRQDELVNSELGANDQSRLNFNLILDEIRSSKNIQIGFGTFTNFVPVTNGPQQGTTLQIIPSTNLNLLIYYWFDTNQDVLFRAAVSNNVVGGVTNSTTSTTNAVAQYLTNLTSMWLTNSMMFRAMDYTGTTMLNVDPNSLTYTNNYNYTIAILFQFAQYQYPLTMVGSNYLYDYYQLTFSATRRNP